VSITGRYDFYSNPTEANGRLSAIPDPAIGSGTTAGKVFAGTPADLLSPQAGFAWDTFGDGKTVVRSGFGIYRDNLPVSVYDLDRFLPPFFELESFALPDFLNPQNAALTQLIYPFSATYHPKFPDVMQYNLNLEREIAPGTILRAGYFGARGNHLTRSAEENPFEPALGQRYNPNLNSLPVSLAMPDEIFCGGRRSRNLTQSCTKILRSLNDGRLGLEWKLITCSTIRISVFRVIRKAPLAWEVTGMPSSRMRRVISPITQAKS